MARVPAWHYDGSVAVRRYVLIEPLGGSFAVFEDGREIGRYDFAELAFNDDQGEYLTYRHDGIDGWRLGVSNPPPRELVDSLPDQVRYGGFIDRIGLGKASIVLAGISAVAAGIFLTAPTWIAPLVPESTEARLGEFMFDDFGGRVCSTPEGDAALAKLVEKLDGPGENLRVEVVNMQMVNAVALPGGRVLLFDGLLNEAETPEEAAAVLGHEIGHVRKRHVMQSLLRQMGLSVLLGGMDGTGGSTISGLLSLSYSRDAEREADEYSISQMKRAGVSPEGGAVLFERMSRGLYPNEDEEAEYSDEARVVFGYLASHPHSDERAEAFRTAAGKRTYDPVLSEEEWFALQDMCMNDPDVADTASVISVTTTNDGDGGEVAADQAAPVRTVAIDPPGKQ